MGSPDKFQKEVKKRVLDLEKVSKEIFEHIESLRLLLADLGPKKLETISTEAPRKEEITLLNCLRYFGYLRFLEKTTSIPDECLVCQKVIECLKHTE